MHDGLPVTGGLLPTQSQAKRICTEHLLTFIYSALDLQFTDIQFAADGIDTAGSHIHP